MTLTVSPPIRIVALVGLVAAFGLGGVFVLAGHKSSPQAVAPVHITHHPFGPGVKSHATAKRVTARGAATKHTTAPSVRASVKTSAKATPTTTPHAKVLHRTPVHPAAEIAALKAGLPVRLARALGAHDVVVVELTNPQAEVDGIAYAEARAGASEAGAGFVALSVLSQSDVGKLTEQFGQVLPDPGLLVYTRPAHLAIRIDGFVDKDTVAQAAQNAATGS